MTPAAPVLVVGGGPAGSATALALARRGIAVFLVEQGDFTTFRPGETLPPIIRPYLVRWNLWEGFLALKPTACFGIEATWESTETRTVDHVTNPYGCAWHVDRRRFDRRLFEAAIEAGAVGRLHTTLLALDRSARGWTALLAHHSGGTTTQPASFIVDASGRLGTVARLLGRRRRATDDRIAVCAHIDRASDETALLVEATEYGWWSSAIVDATVALTYVTSATALRNARHPIDHTCREALQRAPRTRARLGSSDVTGTQVTFAGSSCLNAAAGDGWLAVGDAACTFDPIAGLGIVKALEDAALAADVIGEIFERGESASAAHYDARVQQRFVAYRQRRDAQYRTVQRWPTSAFWAQ